MPDTLSGLIQMMQAAGVETLYAKKLAPNDNSKNQVYLGGDFSSLNIIPYDNVYTDADDIADSKRDRAKAKISFFWLHDDGKLNVAPHAQLILYPKYPEVRLSGFLLGCQKAPSEIMRSREDGRILFLGICKTGQIIAYATPQNTSLAKEVYESNNTEETGVFLRIPFNQEGSDTKEQLLKALKEIYEMNWVDSQKLNKYGAVIPYAAQNGGGYTLESLLGISPNGYSEPDYLGWEIKQYGVRNFEKYSAKSPVTLMTPEPSGGEYQELGIQRFMEKYGYADRSGKHDRLNFGGIYKYNGKANHLTNLKLALEGYDVTSRKISDMTGGIVLLSADDNIAAKWEFSGILEHWNRKHSKAAYIPSLFQTPPPEYAYGSKILLCEQTDFSLFLEAIINSNLYYDPAIKLENASSEKPKIKKRSQFRISHKMLGTLYKKSEYIDLT